MTDKPTFATNRKATGETVAAAINDHVTWVSGKWVTPIRLSIATAYINPGGLGLIEDSLVNKAGSVRLLIGAEPQPPTSRIRLLEDEDGELSRALEGSVRTMIEDRDLLGFTVDADRTARRFVDWLRRGSVEVRRFEDGFMHGKAYLVDCPEDQDAEGVIAGSSNLTYPGLATSHELNLGHYEPTTVNLVRDWFEEMWGGSVDYKQSLIHLYGQRFEEHSPYLVYLRMLYEKYGAEVEALAADSTTGLALASFQKDGVTLANWILAKYSGVIVADGVGLGKTYIAGELIREAVEDNRQRVLVVAPAALRDGPWRAFRADQLFNFEVVSFEELASDDQLGSPGIGPHLQHLKNEYAMVVIDEAHAFRNLGTQRAAALERLLEGFPPKKIVLLTATPVNNSLWDLYNLLAYFVRNDATFASVGISSLRDRFKQATAMNPEELDPSHLYDVLSPVVIRRTRSYVQRYYPDAEVNGRRIVFPTPRVSPVNYSLSGVYPDLLNRIESAMKETETPLAGRLAGGEAVLALARYAPSAFLKSKGPVPAYETQLAGLLKSGLLKRFESSAHSFAKTCETMAKSHDDFLDLLSRGKVATGEALRELANTETDDFEDVIGAHGDNWIVDSAAQYDEESLQRHVESDRDLLRSWSEEARSVSKSDDPKLKALRGELLAILARAEIGVGDETLTRDRRKVIIFSYFADTVRWIADYLEETLADPEFEAYRDRVAVMEGADRGTNTESRVLFGFAPRTTEAPPGYEDTYDILVTTDVLAEGVNLQQAQHVINFDLPWNPMRLVQRNGRIDRIGSSHQEVFSHCFMPDTDLDRILKLEQRLRSKIVQAAASVGTEGEILPGSSVNDHSFTETLDVIEMIREGDAEFLSGPADASSVEEFRQQLRAGLENPIMARQVKELAWGSGSGQAVVGDEPGFVFCARVGNHEDPQFRYVSLANLDEPAITPDVLTCLRKAGAAPSTERVLRDETYELAFDAWGFAKANILEQWLRLTDLRNLQPEIPKAMRDAVALIEKCPPPGLDQQRIESLIDSLNAPYPERILRQVRDALALDTDEVRATALNELRTRLALIAPPVPQPLPVINIDDVHLVCWMAIVPENS
jgi:superfamily II DNA or RNA helicase